VSAFLTALAGEGLLHIEGPDGLKFLQGQATCDTRALSPERALPGVCCTPQGRAVCDFLLLQLGPQHVALRLRRSLLPGAAAHLGKYIIFSKAQLAADRTDWETLGCRGPGAADILKGLAGGLPGARYAARSTDGLSVVQVDDAGERFEVCIDATRHPQHLAALRAGSEVAGEEDWRAGEIRAGVARLEAATAGEFVPQQLNYDLTGHISFNKGCYTGQEIVARLHYRGKSKQRTYLGALEAALDLAPGAPLYSAGDGQAAGTLVNSARVDGRTLCLVATTAQGIAGGLRPAAQGPLLAPLELPYALPQD